MRHGKLLAGLVAVASVAMAAETASAGLVQSQDYLGVPVTFNNGGGTGFGGAVGNGSVTFNVVGSNLRIGFTAGAGLNDLATIFLDTRAGGFTDADMNDGADGARRASSNVTRDSNDVFPIAPDFTVVSASFGTVTFELNAGSTPGHLNFLSFVDPVAGVPQPVEIPLATLGNPTQVDFFVTYVSDSGFSSNETLPADATLNGAGNPGFGTADTTVTFSNFNRLVLSAAPIPEPAAMSLLGLPALALLRRRRGV